MAIKNTIVWINGAFGSGKTTIANELISKFENGCMYDPEELGQFIRAHVADGLRYENFQDHPLWTKLNAETLLHMGQSFKGVVIVPMTLIDEIRLAQFETTLKEGGVDMFMFTLLASSETLKNRLIKRGDEAGTWPHTKIDNCVSILQSDAFEHHVETDNLSVEEVTSKIYEKFMEIS